MLLPSSTLLLLAALYGGVDLTGAEVSGWRTTPLDAYLLSSVPLREGEQLLNKVPATEF